MKALRNALALSQSEFGQRLAGEKQGTVSDWETGRAQIGLATLHLMAHLTGDGPAVYRWLQEGGEMPSIVVNRPATPSADHGQPLALSVLTGTRAGDSGQLIGVPRSEDLDGLPLRELLKRARWWAAGASGHPGTDDLRRLLQAMERALERDGITPAGSPRHR